MHVIIAYTNHKSDVTKLIYHEHVWSYISLIWKGSHQDFIYKEEGFFEIFENRNPSKLPTIQYTYSIYNIVLFRVDCALKQDNYNSLVMYFTINLKVIYVRDGRYSSYIVIQQYHYEVITVSYRFLLNRIITISLLLRITEESL